MTGYDEEMPTVCPVPPWSWGPSSDSAQLTGPGLGSRWPLLGPTSVPSLQFQSHRLVWPSAPSLSPQELVMAWPPLGLRLSPCFSDSSPGRPAPQEQPSWSGPWSPLPLVLWDARLELRLSHRPAPPDHHFSNLRAFPGLCPCWPSFPGPLLSQLPSPAPGPWRWAQDHQACPSLAPETPDGL